MIFVVSTMALMLLLLVDHKGRRDGWVMMRELPTMVSAVRISATRDSSRIAPPSPPGDPALSPGRRQPSEPCARRTWFGSAAPRNWVHDLHGFGPAPA